METTLKQEYELRTDFVLDECRVTTCNTLVLFSALSPIHASNFYRGKDRHDSVLSEDGYVSLP